MADVPENDSRVQVVGHLTICMKRDSEGAVTFDFFPDTSDPVGMTVAFIELVCAFVPKHPHLLVHVAHTCSSREHLREVIAQLSSEARIRLGEYLEDANRSPDTKGGDE